jgi:phosphatidylinositol dimannoside acyltransferase
VPTDSSGVHVTSRERPPDEGRLIQLVYYAYVALSRVALALPERLAYGLAKGAGSIVARVSKKRAVVARNLSRITGEPVESARVRRLTVDTYRSYARYWLETFRLVREGPEFFLERFRASGQENLDGVLARGKGAIVVVGHLGNWDAAGAWVGARGNRLVTVAEVLRPRRMFDFFVDHRARLGMTIYPAQKGAIRQLVDEVEGGAVVAILGDRDLRGRGPEVEFFGETATFPAGPASLALRTGVPLLVAGVFGVVLPDGRRGWQAEISAPIELNEEQSSDAVRTLTQEVARHLERFVAARPEEWHVLQPFWPSDRT